MSLWDKIKSGGEAILTGGASLLQKPATNLIDTISGAKATKKASDILQQQAEQGAKAYAPYQEAGQQALGRISDIMSGKTKVNLSDIPGYTAGLDAGTTAISREAAAQGSRGGGTLASLFGFGQQYAGKAFNDYMTQLSGIANIGMGATQNIVGQQNQAAQAQASGALGTYQDYFNLAKTGLNVAGSTMTGGTSGGGFSLSGLFNNPLAANNNVYGGATGGTDNFYSWG